MPEKEPSFEEQLEALKLALANFEQEPEPLKILDMARDLISAVPERPVNLLNDFMSDRRDFIKSWQQAETEEKKTELKLLIKHVLERIIQALGRRPKS